MVLLKSVVEVATHSMSHLPAELGPDRSGIGIMAVCGNPCRRDTAHRLGRSKECLGGRQIAVLPQHDVDQGTVAIDRTIEIPPSAPHSNVRLIDVPAYQLRPTLPLRLRRRCSVRAGVSLASHSRTAS